MDIIFSASIIAAFFAGVVALFAPCCITVLLPAYLGSAFREKKEILKMTFIFFSGISVILIPIGLGAASLASLFQDYHTELYVAGGALMVVFSVLALFGKGISLLPMKYMHQRKGGSASSVFLLGIFSGAATSCCAPVLAGAITLAVISGAFWKAIIVTFAYVFGMVFPLFLTAYWYDAFHIEQSRIMQGKLFEFKIGSKTIFVHSTNLIAGGIFLLMGLTIIILAATGNTYWAPSFQVSIGDSLFEWTIRLIGAFEEVPNGVWGIIIISVFSLLLWRAFRRGATQNKDTYGK